VIRRLDEEGIAIDDLAFRRSTLDEVFIALTGHVAEPQGERAEQIEGSSV
jgi:oleandomycin transport system ATP-binding protein